MNSAEEATAYLEEIRLMMRELGVSDCEMQEGSLRCDANVNLHVPIGDTFAATPLVEIKNLNSFRAVGRAIKYEAERQFKEYEKDPTGYRIEKIAKSTAGWDEAKGRTEVQRHKEEAADYRYFPDPDLVPVIVSAEQIAAVRAEMGELPQHQRARLVKQYGLSEYDAEVLTAKGRATVAYFETAVKQDPSEDQSPKHHVMHAEPGSFSVTGQPALFKIGKLTANRMSDLIFPRADAIEEFPVPPTAFAEFIQKTTTLSKQDRLDLMAHMLEHGVDVDAAMQTTGIKPQTFDDVTLRVAVVAAIAANPNAVADFKKGKDAAKMSIVGAVMKANKGAPNDVVRKLVDEEMVKV